MGKEEQIIAVSNYIDILNEHGPDSQEARDFRESFSGDLEFLKLLDAADEIKKACCRK